MSGKYSRDKGARGEREAAKILSNITGYDVERSARNGVHDAYDLTGLPGFQIEVKFYGDFTESLADVWWSRIYDTAVRKSNDREALIPLLMYRRNHGPWRIRTLYPDEMDQGSWVEMTPSTFGAFYNIGKWS
jgi:hypothetical protein